MAAGRTKGAIAAFWIQDRSGIAASPKVGTESGASPGVSASEVVAPEVVAPERSVTVTFTVSHALAPPAVTVSRNVRTITPDTCGAVNDGPDVAASVSATTGVPPVCSQVQAGVPAAGPNPLAPPLSVTAVPSSTVRSRPASADRAEGDPTSSSTIVPTPLPDPSAIVAFTGPLSVTTTVSSASTAVSPATDTETVSLVSPAAKVSVPAARAV